jgi:hypothetical protein
VQNFRIEKNQMCTAPGTESPEYPEDSRQEKYFRILPGKVADGLDIAAVIPAFINGSFTYQGEGGEDFVVQDMTEPVFTDEAHPDMLVPVKGTAFFALRVIEVDNLQVFQANLFVELPESFFNSLRSPQLVPGSESMAGIKTDTNAFRFCHAVHDSVDVLETAPDTVLLARCILEKEHCIGTRGFESGIDPFDNPASPTGHSIPEMVTKVGDKVGDPEPAAAVELGYQGSNRLLIYFRFWGGEVGQVRHVVDREDTGSLYFFPEEIRDLVGKREVCPATRVPREHLEDIAPHILCAVHCEIKRSGNRDMHANPYHVTIIPCIGYS